MFCHRFNVKLLYVGWRCRRRHHECGRQKQAILHMLNTNYSNCRLQTISVYIFQLHFELNTAPSIQDVRNVPNYFTHFKTRTASCIRWHALSGVRNDKHTHDKYTILATKCYSHATA